MSENIIWQRGGRARVWGTYARLHADKIGQHWLWSAIERLVAGDTELEILRDFGYVPARELARAVRDIERLGTHTATYQSCPVCATVRSYGYDPEALREDAGAGGTAS